MSKKSVVPLEQTEALPLPAEIENYTRRRGKRIGVPKGTAFCRYGHPHQNVDRAQECNERTLRALCEASGLDYETELGRPLRGLPPAPEAVQEELF